MFKVSNKDTMFLTYFKPCSSVFIVNFEYVIAGCANAFCVFFLFPSRNSNMLTIIFNNYLELRFLVINPFHSTGLILYPLKNSEN